MSLIDISQPIGPSTATWPGDRTVDWSWTARQDDGSSVNVGAIAMSVHTGTHADAPYHVSSTDATIEEVPLSPFVGRVEVVKVDDSKIRPEHVLDIDAPRVLFKTKCSSHPVDEWPSRIPPILPTTVYALADREVTLIGTDAPSVDPLNSSDLPAHHALKEEGVAHLEGLRLSDVHPGRYILVALPLKIESGDAAPVRAVLSTKPLDIDG